MIFFFKVLFGWNENPLHCNLWLFPAPQELGFELVWTICARPSASFLIRSLSWLVYLTWSQQIKACVFLFGLSNVWQRLSNEREMSESFYTWRKRYLLFILYISNSNFVYALCCVKAVADYEKHIHTAKSSNLNNCEGIWTACCHQLKGQSFWILSFPPKN